MLTFFKTLLWYFITYSCNEKELYISRRLQSPHVVKFHGASVYHVDNQTYPLFVMEYCTNDLAKVIYDKSFHAPGNCEDYASTDFDKAMKNAAHYAYQVSSGLMAIHQFGYLHRDLKPENILVSRCCQHMNSLQFI